MKQSYVYKIRKKTKEKHPEIKNAVVIEHLVQKALFRRKLLLAGAIYIASMIIYFLKIKLNVFITDVGSEFYENIEAILLILYGVGTLASVMIFAKSLHNPLTPYEAKQLKEKETYEKTGHK